MAPGRARHKPSTHCAGKAGCSGVTCMLLCGSFARLLVRAADRGCQPAPGLPCALLIEEGSETMQSSGETRREIAKLCLPANNGVRDYIVSDGNATRSVRSLSCLRGRARVGVLPQFALPVGRAPTRHFVTAEALPRRSQTAVPIPDRISGPPANPWQLIDELSAAQHFAAGVHCRSSWQSRQDPTSPVPLLGC